MNNASGQLYVTTTSERDQFTIDNYSGKKFAEGEVVQLNDYFRIGGYFGSYGPHLFAAAPQMFEALKLCRQHMYAHASNTDCGAFDKLCAVLDSIQQAQGEQA